MFEAAKRLLIGDKNYYDMPSWQWFHHAQETSKYSPDIAKLEEYEFQLYFACDETQTRQVKHSFIEDGAYICPAFSQKSFNYWLPNTPFFPAIPMLAEGYVNAMTSTPPIAKIKGQLHAIRPYQFIALDNYKQNGVQFRRERVRLLVPYSAIKLLRDPAIAPFDMAEEDILRGNPHVANGNVPSIYKTKETVVIIRAWMYIGVPEYWDKLISAFDYGSVQSYISKNRAWCQEYYQLRK